MLPGLLPRAVNGVTAWDILRSIPETLLYTVLAIAILMVLAALTRSLLEMLALGLVSVVAMAVFVFLIAVVGNFSFTESAPFDHMAEMTFQRSKWIGFFLCLMVTALIMVWVQYLTRRTRRNLLLTLSALFPCILLPTQFWTWDVVAAVRRPEHQIVDPEGITARIDQQSLKLFRKASTSSRDRRLILHGNIVVENHPPDLNIVPLNVASSLSFGSLSSGDFGYSEFHANKYENRQLRAGGFGSANSDLDDARVEVFEKALAARGKSPGSNARPLT